MRKSALIIANWNYEDSLLRGLVAPSQDAESLAAVLRDQAIGGFDVKVVANAPSYRVCEETEIFFGDRERDDLLLYYFSGHGVKDDDGQLYFAASNTRHKHLRSTAVAAGWVNDIMNGCRSRRQVLLLDCCHSGAFARAKAATGAVNVGNYFTGATGEVGRGKFIITASDAYQYSFEGDAVQGKGVSSVFTEAVVEGLRSGAADRDGDGQITLDELYSFVYNRVRDKAAHQTPRKWASDVEGDVVIASNPRPAQAPLPDDLQGAIDHFVAATREVAVSRLDRLLRGKHRGLSLAAHNALLALAHDDSKLVSSAAEKCLAAWNQETQNQETRMQESGNQDQVPLTARSAPARREEQAQVEQARLASDQAESLRLAKEANERTVREQTERDRLAAQQAEAKRLAKKKAARETRKAWAEAAETERRAREKAAERLAKERAAEAEIRAREKAAAEAAETDRRARETAEAERAEATRIAGEAPASPEAVAEMRQFLYGLRQALIESEAAELEKTREPWSPKAAPNAEVAVQPVKGGSAGLEKKRTGWSPKAASGTDGAGQPAAGGSAWVGGQWVAPADEPKPSRAGELKVWFLFIILLGLASLGFISVWIWDHFFP